MLTLAQALRLARPGNSASDPTSTGPVTIALVGAGGKTTAMFALARQLRPALVTTTTHLGVWQASAADSHLVWSLSAPPWEAASAPLDRDVILVTRALDKAGQRLAGLAIDEVAALRSWPGGLGRSLLIEADGSRGRPLKAPASHEPAMPDHADLVVVTAGLSGLGTPLDDSHVHRPDAFSRLSGVMAGAGIDVPALARVLTHPEGGLKHIPTGARRVALLNQADTDALARQGRELAQRLLPTYHAVVIAHHQGLTVHGLHAPESAGAASVIGVHEPVGGIILAAGGSSRYGVPKPLLEFRGKPFVRAVAETALAAGLSPVVIVTGACHEPVLAAVGGLQVRAVHNAAWADGQSTSVKAGLGTLSGEVGAVVFLMADQPHVPVDLIRALTDRHAATFGPVVAPVVHGCRVSPVLFDRSTFRDFAALTGDVGGRGVLVKHPVEAVAWPDDRLLLDVDTPEDYRRLLDQP